MTPTPGFEARWCGETKPELRTGVGHKIMTDYSGKEIYYLIYRHPIHRKSGWERNDKDIIFRGNFGGNINYIIYYYI